MFSWLPSENTEKRREIINGYLQRLEELDKADQALMLNWTKWALQRGDHHALIDNLKLRLNCCSNWKQIKELKELNDENYSEFTT